MIGLLVVDAYYIVQKMKPHLTYASNAPSLRAYGSLARFTSVQKGKSLDLQTLWIEWRREKKNPLIYQKSMGSVDDCTMPINLE